MKDIIEIENIIPVDYQKHLEELMTSFEFPWLFNKNMVSGDDCFLDDPNNHAGFNHFFFEHSKPISNFFNLVYPLVLSITSRAEVPFNRLFRMRANMTLPNCRSTQEYHMPHIDSFFPHWNAIYYVNDSDGDTVIFNETNDTYDSGIDDVMKIQSGNFTLKHRVTPKRGKLLVFPGKYYHSSSPVQNNKYRCVININLGNMLL